MKSTLDLALCKLVFRGSCNTCPPSIDSHSQYTSIFKELAEECAGINIDLIDAKTSNELLNSITRIKNSIDWAHFLSYLDSTQNSADRPRWLFRADTMNPTEAGKECLMSSWGLKADLWTPDYSEEKLQWDTECKRITTIQSFLEELQRHLRKISAPCKTYLVSMTPHLEWALHRTGQKGRRGSNFYKEGLNGLAVIDANRIRNTPGAALLRVKDVIAYADSHVAGISFGPDVRRWAQNCDEHVAINFVPSAALAGWTPWTTLYEPQSQECLLLECFTTYYTLGLWRQNLVSDTSPREQVAKKVARLATIMTESSPADGDFDLQIAISSIVESSDWGYPAARDKPTIIAAAELWTKIHIMTEEFQRLCGTA